MILYNMRYRGPFEYDKFVLNILQFHNEVSLIMQGELGDTSKNINSLLAHKQKVNEKFEQVTQQAEDLYITTLNFKE